MFKNCDNSSHFSARTSVVRVRNNEYKWAKWAILRYFGQVQENNNFKSGSEWYEETENLRRVSD